MRHQKRGRRLKRTNQQQKALFRSLASSLIMKEKITTTEAKAKELRKFIERVITKAKKGSLADKRTLMANFPKNVYKKIFDTLVKRYQNRNGGYTKVIKTGPRKSDNAKMAIIQLINKQASK